MVFLWQQCVHFQAVCLYICLSICQFVCLFVRPCIRPSIHTSIHPSISGHILSRIYNCTKPGNRAIGNATLLILHCTFQFNNYTNCYQLHTKIMSWSIWCTALGFLHFLTDSCHSVITDSCHPLVKACSDRREMNNYMLALYDPRLRSSLSYRTIRN